MSLLLGHLPLRAAPAPHDTVRIKRWLEAAGSYTTKDPLKSLALADSALKLARQCGQPRLEIWSILTMSVTYRTKADYSNATELAQQAYRMSRSGKIKKPAVIEWTVLNLLSGIALDRGRMVEANEFMRQKLVVAKKTGMDPYIVLSLNDLGSSLSELKQYAEADSYLRQGLALCQQIHGQPLAALILPRILANLAYNEMYMGRLPAALALANQTLRAARQQADSAVVYNGLGTRAMVRSRLGQHAGAVADADMAVRLALREGHIDELSALRSELSGIYERAGRPKEALAAERASRHLNDSIRSASVEEKVSELNTKFGVEQQKARIERLTQQQRIAALSADKARAQARLWGGLALALALLLAVGGWLLRQVRRSRAQLQLSEAGLRAANRVKDQANATKDQVMRIIGHDLRGPLTAFQQIAPSFAELADAPDPAEQRLLAQALGDSARAVRELVDNLLNWARVQTGDLAVLPQPVRLAVVAQSMEGVFGPLAAAKGVALRVACAPNVPPVLHTDPNLLGAVLRNLLGNAIKFTPSGGEVRLEITADTTTANAALAPADAPPTVLLTIADTGRGMGPVQLAAALGGEPVPSTQGTNGEPGTGLGLAVCRHFAGLLRAEWRGESAPGQGTRWTLALPAAG